MLVRENGDCINDQETLVRDGIEREGWVWVESESATDGLDYTWIGPQDTVSQVLRERAVAQELTLQTCGTSEPDDRRHDKLRDPSASPNYPSQRRLIPAEQDDPLCSIAAGLSIPHHNDKPPRKRKR